MQYLEEVGHQQEAVAGCNSSFSFAFASGDEEEEEEEDY